MKEPNREPTGQSWMRCQPAGSSADVCHDVARRQCLYVALDAVDLINQVQRDICPPGFVLGLHFLRFNELAPCMRPATHALNAWLRGHGVVTGVIVGRQLPAITFQQARRHLLRTAG